MVLSLSFCTITAYHLRCLQQASSPVGILLFIGVAPVPSQIGNGTATTARRGDWSATNKGICNSQNLDSHGLYAQLVNLQMIRRILLMVAVRQGLIVTTQLVQLPIVCQHVLLSRLHLTFGILHIEGLYLSDY